MDILHRIGFERTSPETVYASLTTIDGLAGWWTRDTTGSTEDGGTIAFRFGDLGGFDMKVVETRAAEHVTWDVTDGPEEWIGTSVTWDLRQEGDWTILMFAHTGWREQVEFMHHCSTKWASFLLSLKAYVETGTGAPHPDDVTISDWH